MAFTDLYHAMYLTVVILVSMICVNSNFTEIPPPLGPPEVEKREILFPMGERLLKMLMNPDEFNGTDSDKCLTSVYKYYNRLDDILMRVRTENMRAMKIMEHLKKIGGPPHLNVTIDFTKLQKYYKFDDEGIEEVREALNRTNIAWEEMKLEPKDDEWSHWNSDEISFEI